MGMGAGENIINISYIITHSLVDISENGLVECCSMRACIREIGWLVWTRENSRTVGILSAIVEAGSPFRQTVKEVAGN